MQGSEIKHKTITHIDLPRKKLVIFRVGIDVGHRLLLASFANKGHVLAELRRDIKLAPPM